MVAYAISLHIRSCSVTETIVTVTGGLQGLRVAILGSVAPYLKDSAPQLSSADAGEPLGA